MSLADIRDGLIATVVAYGKYGPSEISACDFGITEFSASCLVLQPGPNTRFYPQAGLGQSACGSTRKKRKEWTIAGIGMVKDKGDPRVLLGDLWKMCDDIYDSVNSDDTLDGKAMTSHITLMSRPSIDAFITDGDVDWGYITFALEATEIDGWTGA
ncbi:MAG: hypothetical protein ACW99J_15535 [Candidatus Thorarchaeota archaeon]|jgi:hypothetical protein